MSLLRLNSVQVVLFLIVLTADPKQQRERERERERERFVEEGVSLDVNGILLSDLFFSTTNRYVKCDNRDPSSCSTR